MEKITEATKAIYRNELYDGVSDFLNDNTDYNQEPGTKGILVTLPDGLFAEITVVIKNPAKFNIEVERANYAEKVAKAAERKANAEAKAEKDAAKAQAKADAQAVKEAADAEVDA